MARAAASPLVEPVCRDSRALPGSNRVAPRDRRSVARWVFRDGRARTVTRVACPLLSTDSTGCCRESAYAGRRSRHDLTHRRRLEQPVMVAGAMPTCLRMRARTQRSLPRGAARARARETRVARPLRVRQSVGRWPLDISSSRSHACAERDLGCDPRPRNPRANPFERRGRKATGLRA
jgi:hypothetical protein